MGESSNHDVPPSIVAFAGRLSPRVRAALPRWEWKWYPECRFSREELQRRLAEKGIPEWPFLWPLEEAFAGAEAELGGWRLSFGITAGLPYVERERLVDERGRIRFVPIADWGNDLLLLDAKGQVYVLTERGALTLIDPSFESFLERHAMSPALDDWSPTLFTAYLEPKAAASALAAHLGVPPLAEVSNDLYRWWQDDTRTLHEGGDMETPSALWCKTLAGLVRDVESAASICPTLKIKPIPSYDEPHVEVLGVEEIRARAPSMEALAARPGARRFELAGQPSLHEGKPPSTGDVWISGEGETLRIDVLERREGQVVNYWQLTPTGSHALLMSWYGKG